LKRGAGEGWRMSVGTIVINKKKYYIEERRILNTVRRREVNFEQVERYRKE
jgi:hypothetical protein